jgi:hypothetical protein
VSRQRPTLDERDRRRDAVVRLSREGHPAAVIAAALGVSVSIVTADRNARRQDLEGVRLYASRKKHFPPAPEPVDWVSEPERVLPPAWQLTSPVVPVQTMLKGLGNAENRLAFNQREARQAGDEAWNVVAQVTLKDAIARLQGMLAVLEDASAADDAARNGRTDVTLPAGLPHNGGRMLHLPPAGSGVLPTLPFGYLWRYYWAGLPVDDEAVRLVALQFHSTHARVEQADAELKQALKSR